MTERSDQGSLVEAALEAVGDAVLAVDEDMVVVRANASARRIVGVHAGRTLDDVPVGAELATADGPVVRALRGEESDGVLVHLDPADGGPLMSVEVTGRSARDASGRVIGAIAVLHDVTERLERESVHAQAELHSEQVYGAILQNLPNGAVFLVDRDLRYVAVKGGVSSEVGRAVHDLPWTRVIGLHVRDAVPAENLEQVLGVYRAALAGQRVRIEVRREGRTLEVNAAPIRGLDGQVTHALALLYDVTERLQEAENLRRTRDLVARERALLRASLEHIPEGVALFDSDQRVILANAAFAALLDVPLRELEGMHEASLRGRVEGIASDPSSVSRAFAEGLQEIVIEIQRPRRRVLRRSRTELELPSGSAALTTWRDVTEEHDELMKRDRQLLVDALTGIANRRAAELALAAAESTVRGGTALAVAVIDVDHFKQVNDQLGHAAGDEVLRRVAHTLSSVARETDLVARWGGEEFLAVLRGRAEGAVRFAERARAAVEALRDPAVPRVTISVGVAELHAGEPPIEAVARADARLYDAKRDGRNRVRS